MKRWKLAICIWSVIDPDWSARDGAHEALLRLAAMGAEFFVVTELHPRLWEEALRRFRELFPGADLPRENWLFSGDYDGGKACPARKGEIVSWIEAEVLVDVRPQYVNAALSNGIHAIWLGGPKCWFSEKTLVILKDVGITIPDTGVDWPTAVQMIRYIVRK